MQTHACSNHLRLCHMCVMWHVSQNVPFDSIFKTSNDLPMVFRRDGWISTLCFFRKLSERWAWIVSLCQEIACAHDYDWGPPKKFWLNNSTPSQKSHYIRHHLFYHTTNSFVVLTLGWRSWASSSSVVRRRWSTSDITVASELERKVFRPGRS